MTTARTITPKKVREFPDYLDFDRLRAEGISHIQALAGQTWTDHNSHDPGITILELLCYALTDLGYRTNLDIRDLLAQPPSIPATASSTVDNNFPTAAHSLSCNPLTILDLRKLLIDTAGVRNAWLSVVAPTDGANPTEPALVIDADTRQLTVAVSADKNQPRIYLNGLYDVLLELDDAYLAQQVANGETTTSVTNRILDQVSEKLHAHRNLCEDYLTIRILRDETISLCGEIELTTNALPDDVMLNILDQVQEFLSPTISFYTINEMLAKGATPDEIFEGRPLIPYQNASGDSSTGQSFGFVDTKQLEAAERRQVIHVSDIYRVLLGIDGVTAVKNLRLVNLTNGANLEGEEWLLPLTPDTFRPVLDALKSMNSLVLSKRNVVYSVNTDHVLKFFTRKIANRLKVPKKPEELDLPITLGTYRNNPVDERSNSLTDGLGYHFSIQNDLPATYGTSRVSFPANANTANERQRQAQALQLKGYLLFFDQLLANYLAQLANVRSLFSTKLDPATDSVAASGSLSDVAFLEKLLPYSITPAPGNPINSFFSEGERIAKVIDPVTKQRRVFATPAERDTALNQIIKAFDDDSIDRSFPKEPTNGRFYFQVISQGLHPVVLRSQKTYATADDAEAALGLVRFLATLKDSYLSREKRNAAEHRYTFDWIFRWPADFNQIMRQITESQSDYLRRKNALFDHLLARFAEDFTDYTLLMFGLNKNSTQPLSAETIARDKAHFLEAYPEISRNRSRGFNQQMLPDAYWQWKNSSGLENRLATLLGFNRVESKPTKQLNFFELDEAVRKQFFVHDRQGLLLLQSPQPSRIGELADFQNAVQESVNGPDAFVPTHCETEHVFGFRMKDRSGCMVAVHPDTYGTPESRDAMLRYTRLVIRDVDRLPVDFVPQQKGFYATVLKPDGSLVFRSVVIASTQAEARQIALTIRRAATHKDYYQPLARSAKGFGFQLRSQPKDTKNVESGNVLAIHPTYYLTAEKRNEAIEQTIRFFAGNPLRLAIESTPVRHYWTVPLSKGNRLQSIHSFKTARQTQAAADRAMRLPKEARAVRLQHHSDDTFTVQFIERRTYPSVQPDERPHTVQLILAQTQPVATLPEAEQLRDDIQRLTDSYTVQLDKKPAQFYAQLIADGHEDEVWLRDVRLFDTVDEAEIAFDEILEAACGDSWLKDDTINNGCAHGFSLQDPRSGNVLATHPALYDTIRERDDVLTTIQTLSCTHRIRFEAEERSDSWQFELLCPNSEGRLSAMLREPAGSTHATEAESRQFFEKKVRDKLVNVQPAFIEPTGEPGSFSFQLHVDNQILAEHPESYPTNAERDVVINKVIHCLTAVNEAYTQQSDVFVCPGDKFPPPGLASRRWRVRDANAPIAVYEQSFATSEEAKKFADQLILSNRCQIPPYSDLVVGEGATPPGGYWVIRDKSRIMWQSPDTYAPATEARQAFEATLMRVITASLSLDNYYIRSVTDEQTQTTRFRIDLIDSGHRPIATSGLFDNAILAQQGIGLRHDYARRFPFYTTIDGIYFQLYDPRNQQVIWRSTTAYPTWQKALDGFLAFVDMLGFESHYASVSNQDKSWHIALIDVLLESPSSFVINPEPTTSLDDPQAQSTEANLELRDDQLDELGWTQVENFLDRYQATDETQVVRPYIDYTDGCQYRFQLVSDTYALARHLGAFHTNADREIRRDDLFLAWRNRAVAPEAAQKLRDKILAKVPTFSQSRQPVANLFSVIDSGVYMLGVLDKRTDDRFVIEDDAYQFSSEEELIESIRQLLTALSPSVIMDRADGKQGFEIRVIVGTESYQLAGLGHTYDFPHFEIWESVAAYKEGALDASGHCMKLLNDKTNYSRYQATDQSRTLMLTDSAQVLATHPRRYTTISLCQRAIQRTLSYVDSEGFHIVEHILLRPRQFLPSVNSLLLPIQIRQEALTGPALASDFDGYIPGSDPYSMTATVVLPYWSRRFRSVDFRQFFENTLRRETPVHILLNIVWITPEQMQRFEDRLRRWLETLAQPLSAEFTQQTSALTELLGQLTNTFPQAILNDCNGAPIILDETTID